jgi:hypothetical protein
MLLACGPAVGASRTTLVLLRRRRPLQPNVIRAGGGLKCSGPVAVCGEMHRVWHGFRLATAPIWRNACLERQLRIPVRRTGSRLWSARKPAKRYPFPTLSPLNLRASCIHRPRLKTTHHIPRSERSDGARASEAGTPSKLSRRCQAPSHLQRRIRTGGQHGRDQQFRSPVRAHS